MIVCALALPAWFMLSGLAQASSWLLAVAVALAGCLHYVFWRLLPAYTQKGRECMKQIEGFRLFLTGGQMVKTQEQFERYLPYAPGGLPCQLTQQP